MLMKTSWFFDKLEKVLPSLSLSPLLDEAPFPGQLQQDRWISGICLDAQCQKKEKKKNQYLIIPS